MPQRRSFEQNTRRSNENPISFFPFSSNPQFRAGRVVTRDARHTPPPMLASIIGRSLSPSFRALSTAGPAKTSTLTNTLSTIGVPPAPPSKQQPSPLPSVPDAPGIPPAEDPLLHYVTSNIMQGGRRAKASRITSKTLLYIHTLTREPPLPLFRKAVELAAPAVRIVNNSWGAKSVPTPLPLSEKQRTRYAV